MTSQQTGMTHFLDRLQNHTVVWTLSSLTILFNVTCLVFDLLIASRISQVALPIALRILTFVTLGTEVLGTGVVIYVSIRTVKHLRTNSLGPRRSTWTEFSILSAVVLVSVLATGTALVWLLIQQNALPAQSYQQSTIILVAVWTGVWGLATLLEILLLAILASWIHQALRNQSVARLDLDFGIRVPSMAEIRPPTQDTMQSFHSGEITLHSPPRTPTSRRPATSGRSSITRVGPGSSRSKLVPRGSNKSSLDLPLYQLPDEAASDSAFDNWDTSTVHREMRATIQSSSPVVRPVLETIPGSRPDSPANALDGPFPPSSPPTSSSSPHATSSDRPTALGWDPSSPSRPSTSSPPSSPPNFSRPTSSHRNKSLAPAFDDLQDDLIHPLFRPNSPRPPPLALGGTVVMASPMAELAITPKTLARLRSNTLPRHWRAMPSVGSVTSHSSIPSAPGSPGIGSPGPSVADEEEELPPILPGFVMTAGARTSLVGYGRRKYTRHRRPSQRSVDARMSGDLI